MPAERHGTCEWRAAAVVVVGLVLLAALVAEARAAAAECASLQSQDTDSMTPCSDFLHYCYSLATHGWLKAALCGILPCKVTRSVAGGV